MILLNLLRNMQFFRKKYKKSSCNISLTIGYSKKFSLRKKPN